MSDTALFDTVNKAAQAASEAADRDAAALREREAAGATKAQKQATRGMIARVVSAALILAAVIHFTKIGWMAHELAGGLLMLLMAWTGAWVGAWLQYRFGKGGAMYGKV